MTPSRPQTIMARFERFGNREAMVRNARKLKETGIFINEDLCPASQEINKSQFPLTKKARENGKIAFFVFKLIIKERTSERSGPTSDDAATSGGGGDVRMALHLRQVVL